jgi:hypothetical protein
LIEEVPPEWGYDPINKEKMRLRDLIDVILRSGDVRGASIIRAYHTWGWRR